MNMHWIINLSLALFTLVWDTPYQKIKSTDRPNIILIMADDLGYETLSCNGGLSYHTPRLDQLASEGVRFEHAYAMPLCTPSRVQIMTGKYNFRNYEKFGYLNPGEKTFAHLLKDAGYQTAIAGKWQLSGGIEAPYHFGFDQHCLWQLESGDFWYRYKNPVVYQNGQKLNHMQGKYGPEVFTDFILNTLKSFEEKEEPFFIYYPMALVHDPFQPTPLDNEFENYQIEGLNDTIYFKSMVHFMDRQVGKIVDKLEELQISEETLIIFTGDNGTDRKVVSNTIHGKVKGDKGYTTKAGTHVPLIMYWKGAEKSGTVSEALVDFTDFLPTLAACAAVSIPENWHHDGQSFLHQIIGEKGKDREWIFCDYDAKGRDFPVRRFAQNRDWKLYDEGRFFNFANDPEEKETLDVDRLEGSALRNYHALNKVLQRYSE